MNPYAPPTRPVGAEHIPGDSTDLYIETLPSPMVRTAGVAAVITGVAMLFSCMRFVLSGAEGFLALFIEATLVALGAAQIGVAWGITGGRSLWMYVGLASVPFVGIASLFVLLTGSFVGMFGMSLAILDAVLLALGFDKIRRMARARAQMRAAKS